jgi:signal transduction histidine kinase
LDAIEETGEVIITTQQKGRNIEVSFEDTGRGIAEEDLSKIFEPFFTTKPADKGTGLGLSICENIVNKHGGTIWVNSQLGLGTTFHIALPVKEKG